jgi:hypothetical protein
VEEQWRRPEPAWRRGWAGHWVKSAARRCALGASTGQERLDPILLPRAPRRREEEDGDRHLLVLGIAGHAATWTSWTRGERLRYAGPAGNSPSTSPCSWGWRPSCTCAGLNLLSSPACKPRVEATCRFWASTAASARWSGHGSQGEPQLQWLLQLHWQWNEPRVCAGYWLLHALNLSLC